MIKNTYVSEYISDCINAFLEEFGADVNKALFIPAHNIQSQGLVDCGGEVKYSVVLIDNNNDESILYLPYTIFDPTDKHIYMNGNEQLVWYLTDLLYRDGLEEGEQVIRERVARMEEKCG